MPRHSLLLFTPFVVLSLHAADWPQWRGPHFDGSTSEKDIPAEFSRTNNVLWTAPMPGPSGSTPVVWGDYVFVAAADESTKACIGIALDRLSGRELWRVKIAEGYGQDRMSTFSNSSPLTDGKHVWLLFSRGDLVCLDMQG